MARAKSKKESMVVNTEELFEALKLMADESGIPEDYLAEKIRTAIIGAAKKDFGGKDVVFCDVNITEKIFKVYVRKTVVNDIEDEYTQIMIEDALKVDKAATVGEFVDIPLETKQFGRIVAQNAKHVIRQGVKEAERGQTFEEFQSRNKELVTAVVQRIDPKTGNATITIGRGEAVLPKTEQVPDEELREGDHIKVYIVDVKNDDRGPKVMISRTHPGLVKRMFETEVPEIYDGTIEIKAISRQAGSRTKMAVWSQNPEVDAVGACIGQRGARVNTIVEELHGEKIDIVKYSEDPAAFITEALSPAKVLTVTVLSESDPKACKVTVPDSQLSLAIGNKGQNVRLAAKLTGWKIDIHPESGYYGEDDDSVQ